MTAQLLRQPGGFEGLLFGLEHPGADDLSITDLQDLKKGGRLDSGPAVRALPADPQGWR